VDESGLVVFVCALILLAIILGPVKNIWQNDTYRQTLIDCPYCEGEVPRTAIKCMHCGSSLNAAQNQTWVCSNCKAEVPRTEGKCTHCGNNIETYLVCSDCRGEVPKNAIKCMHCGSKL
jgi:DNA-directed RNA polymerase subunit RPC12/RpoP